MVYGTAIEHRNNIFWFQLGLLPSGRAIAKCNAYNAAKFIVEQIAGFVIGHGINIQCIQIVSFLSAVTG